MSKPIRIKVESKEYEEAKSKGYVYGKNLDVRPIQYVYVMLGVERLYEMKPWELEANKRIFFDCTIEVSQSESDCDEGICTEVVKQASVIIYA